MIKKISVVLFILFFFAIVIIFKMREERILKYAERKFVVYIYRHSKIKLISIMKYENDGQNTFITEFEKLKDYYPSRRRRYIDPFKEEYRIVRDTILCYAKNRRLVGKISSILSDSRFGGQSVVVPRVPGVRDYSIFASSEASPKDYTRFDSSKTGKKNYDKLVKLALLLDELTINYGKRSIDTLIINSKKELYLLMRRDVLRPNLQPPKDIGVEKRK